MDKIVITHLVGAGDDLFALDSRGRVWALLEEGESRPRWELLPELPQAELREVKTEGGS